MFARSDLNFGILKKHCNIVTVNCETNNLPLGDNELLRKLGHELLGEMLVHSDGVGVEDV